MTSTFTTQSNTFSTRLGAANSDAPNAETFEASGHPNTVESTWSDNMTLPETAGGPKAQQRSRTVHIGSCCIEGIAYCGTELTGFTSSDSSLMCKTCGYFDGMDACGFCLKDLRAEGGI